MWPARQSISSPPSSSLSISHAFKATLLKLYNIPAESTVETTCAPNVAPPRSVESVYSRRCGLRCPTASRGRASGSLPKDDKGSALTSASLRLASGPLRRGKTTCT